MAGAVEIIDSVKKIINNWANTQMPLTLNADAGDSILTIRNSNRFQIGDEIFLRDPIQGGELSNHVISIPDATHVELAAPIENNWTVNQATYLQKIYNGQMIQGIYTGNPDNIPMYPAITVNATSRDSEWLTIDSTKEDFKVDVAVYTKASTMESGYESCIRLTETIIFGLKRNIHPLVAPYETTAVTSNIDSSDTFITLADTSNLYVGAHAIIEDEWNFSEVIVKKVINNTTVELRYPAACSFSMDDDIQFILLDRFIYNSWPNSTNFGEVYKGTLLKAAKISWFAWEELLWCYPPKDTFLH